MPSKPSPYKVKPDKSLMEEGRAGSDHPHSSMDRIMKGVDKTADKMKARVTPDKIKDYSGWLLQHADEETIIENGKPVKATIIKSFPDREGILEDIRKTPLDPKEHPRRKK